MPGTTTIVHLMRHGEVHNPEGVLYGRLPDYHLSERGRAMAQRVADHLLAGGTPVRHILGAGRVEEATLSAGASVAEDGQVTYPAFSGYPSPRRRRTVEP